MSDLVKRLRAITGRDWEYTLTYNGVRLEAADEIEKLKLSRDNLRGSYDWCVEKLNAGRDEIPLPLEHYVGEVVRQRDEAVAALRELVRLKDLHDELDKHEPSISDDTRRAWEAGNAEYYRCKPLAWDTARRLLNQPDERKRG